MEEFERRQKSVPPVDKCKDPQHAADKAECAAIEFADEKRKEISGG